MTRLKRITNKIFGNTASTTGSPDTGAEIGQFGSAKAGTYNATADVETIQALPAYEQGWIGAVIPDQQYPTLPEMTGVNKVLSYQTGYLMQEGIPEWDSGTTYYKNSIVKYAKVTTTQTTTASIGASTGITSASVNKNTFVSQISVDGNYTFTYNGTSWLYNDIATDLNIYGITYTGTPAENDAITVTLTTTTSIGDLTLYISLTDDNINHNPLTDTTYWKEFGLGGGSGLENKITNCLLEVPQRIKLELNDGVLTLKKGSQVIVPNGFEADGTTPKFDEVVIKNDISQTVTSAWGTGKHILCYNRTDNAFLLRIAHASGTSPSGDYTIYYNTATNVVRDTNITDKELSLPIGFATVGNLAFTSIDQVFNGMGYIGSTAWVDKGVKGLIPNGRNADGSLKNIEFTTSRVLTKTSTGTTPFVLGINQNSFSIDVVYFYSQEEKPTASNYIWYKPSENILIDHDGIIRQGCVCIDASRVNGTITSFQPKLPFRAVDYNDFREQLATKTDMLQASGAGMPSRKYIDLTLGASGSTYTAPANGWFYFYGETSQANQWVSMYSNFKIGMTGNSAFSSFGVPCYVPVLKNDTIRIYYNIPWSSKSQFGFYYAQGSKGEV